MAKTYDMMAFYGVGNHGGGPTVELLEKMKKELDSRFVYSSPDKYFEDADESTLMILKDDLQFHAKGCYSTYSEVKRNNRECENRLYSAEALSVLTRELLGTPYDGAELRRAWMNVLFNQFHDILCGCSIKDALVDASYSHGETLAIAQRTANLALSQISWQIDTIGDNAPMVTKFGNIPWIDANGLGTPLVVFNPLAHPINTVVTVAQKPKKICTHDGTELSLQVVRATRSNNEDKYDTIFGAAVPAYGYRVFRVYYEADAVSEIENPFTCTGCSIDNGVIAVTVDTASGEISSIVDKRCDRELMSDKASTFLVDETRCDTWAHGVKEFRDVTDVGAFGSVNLIENGPVRATLRSVVRISESTVTRDISLTAGSDTVTVKTVIDFHEKHRMLKFSLPVSLKKPEVLCEIPFGSIERPTDGTEQVCGSWFLMRDGERGLGVANDSKYSFDAKDNVLTLTVLRGAIIADHYAGEHRDEFCEYMEQGIHEFTYTLFPYRSVADTVKHARELNCKAEYVLETFHKGNLPLEYSAVSTDAQNVSVTAIKSHEDTDGITLRLYETDGIDTRVNVRLFDKSFSLFVPKSSVKTVIVFSDGTVCESDFLE